MCVCTMAGIPFWYPGDMWRLQVVRSDTKSATLKPRLELLPRSDKHRRVHVCCDRRRLEIESAEICYLFFSKNIYLTLEICKKLHF